ncbi:MAG: hypothetical protein NTZ42_00990, partial [Candidatus Gribaldobacteria bacterium]|nr:hypothetical protein [Candidatus Gribaldobacteria bacterium]
LQEAKRVLKIGGIFVLTVWQPKDKQWRFLGLLRGMDFGDVIEKWFGNNKGERYFHCFSEKELLNLAKEAGFAVIKSGVISNEKGNRNNIYLVCSRGLMDKA